MNKIPTIFERDWDGNRGVIDKVAAGCDWVFNGEGIATEKIDGTNIRITITDGNLVKVEKRRNPTKEEKEKGVEPYYVDCHEGDPSNKHIFKAVKGWRGRRELCPDGSYPCEAFGGKIQGNPLSVEPDLYFFTRHPITVKAPILTFEGIKEHVMSLKSGLNPDKHAEGIVWHHPADGRMAKIKRKDFK